MRKTRFAVAMFVGGLLIAGQGDSPAQSYPTKPVRVVTLAPGASADFVARLIAPGLSERLGKSMIVDNRSGNAVIPATIVAKSPADGYTLLVIPDAFWLLPFMQEVSYDPIKEFAPIALISVTPLLIVVHPSLAVKSVAELIARAKANPGALNYASGISGSATHLSAELFKAMAGINIVRIGYKGGGPALTALMSGEVQLMFGNASGVAPYVSSGRLRALAVTSAQPSRLFPDLPTVSSSGLPGYEAVSKMAIFAPAGTPAAIINRLNQEIVRVLSDTDIKERFIKAGAEVIASSPGQLEANMKSDMATLGKLIRDAGIRAR